MKTPLKQIILNYIARQNYWVRGIDIERLALSLYYKASNASRRCRELEREGKIERRLENGFVSYMVKPTPPDTRSEIEKQRDFIINNNL